MNKIAFAVGVAEGIKAAAFGVPPVAGAVKSIGGVTKKLVDGKWVDVGAGGHGLAARIADWFGKAPAPVPVTVRGVNRGGAFVPRAS